MDNEKEKLELEKQKIELEKMRIELERQKFEFEKEKQKSTNQPNETKIDKDENDTINDNPESKNKEIPFSEIKVEMEIGFNDPNGNLLSGKITQIYTDKENKIIGCEVGTDDERLFDLSIQEGDKIYVPIKHSNKLNNKIKLITALILLSLIVIGYIIYNNKAEVNNDIIEFDGKKLIPYKEIFFRGESFFTISKENYYRIVQILNREGVYSEPYAFAAISLYKEYPNTNWNFPDKKLFIAEKEWQFKYNEQYHFSTGILPIWIHGYSAGYIFSPKTLKIIQYVEQ